MKLRQAKAPLAKVEIDWRYLSLWFLYSGGVECLYLDATFHHCSVRKSGMRSVLVGIAVPLFRTRAGGVEAGGL